MAHVGILIGCLAAVALFGLFAVQGPQWDCKAGIKRLYEGKDVCFVVRALPVDNTASTDIDAIWFVGQRGLIRRQSGEISVFSFHIDDDGLIVIHASPARRDGAGYLVANDVLYRLNVAFQCRQNELIMRWHEESTEQDREQVMVGSALNYAFQRRFEAAMWSDRPDLWSLVSDVP